MRDGKIRQKRNIYIRGHVIVGGVNALLGRPYFRRRAIKSHRSAFVRDFRGSPRPFVRHIYIYTSERYYYPTRKRANVNGVFAARKRRTFETFGGVEKNISRLFSKITAQRTGTNACSHFLDRRTRNVHIRIISIRPYGRFSSILVISSDSRYISGTLRRHDFDGVNI